MEEKGSDGSLATHLLNDAWLELFDSAVLIFIDAIASVSRSGLGRVTRMENPELNDLVDAPRERLDAEYKLKFRSSKRREVASLPPHSCSSRIVKASNCKLLTKN